MPSASLRSMNCRTPAWPDPRGRSTPQTRLIPARQRARTPSRVARAGRRPSVSDCGRGMGKHLFEHEPGHKQRQGEVERLPAYIENERLSASQLVLELAKVGLQADAHERQAKKPAAQALGSVRSGRGDGLALDSQGG